VTDGGDEPGSARRWSSRFVALLHGRRVRGLAVGSSTLCLIWLVTSYFVIVKPHVDGLTHVDAVIVLGPPNANGRLVLARQMVADGIADNLIISTSTPDHYYSGQPCVRGYLPEAPTVHVICFVPQPATTRGEAMELGRVAASHGWTRIIVVTSTYHVSRARLILKRCFAGKLYVVAAHTGITKAEWAYQFFYQTGGFIRAALHRGC
jgi:hypothetical protein